MDIYLKNLSLKSFVMWLIAANPDTKYEYRHRICDAVGNLGKDNVLNEIEKQATKMKSFPEVIATSKLVKDIKIEGSRKKEVL